MEFKNKESDGLDFVCLALGTLTLYRIHPAGGIWQMAVRTGDSSHTSWLIGCSQEAACLFNQARKSCLELPARTAMISAEFKVVRQDSRIAGLD